MLAADHFRAMDTDIDVLVAGGTPVPVFLAVKLLFEQQEQRFSRFRPASLLSALNRGEVVTDGQFARCCRMAVDAWEFTGGLFNPMVLPALERAGYDRSFDDVRGGAPQTSRVPSPLGALRISADAVELREGRLDLGGIVKGWTVDLAIEELSRACEGLLINAGGDLRCSGSDDGGRGWVASVAGERDNLPDAWSGPMDGALATSTTKKRRWRTTTGAEAHHLIDPRTGLPGASPYDQVSIWAAETWRAECWAKAVLIGGRPVAQAAARLVDGVLALGPAGLQEAWGRPAP